MALISEEEKLRRREAIESVIGTNAMEGLFLNAPTLLLMRRFEEGEIDMGELSAAIDLHIHSMSPSRYPAAVEGASVDAA